MKTNSAFCCILLAFSSLSDPITNRTWVASNGQKLEATLKYFEKDGTTTLVSRNKEFKVQYDKLSQEDKDYLDLLSDPYGENERRINNRKSKESSERTDKVLAYIHNAVKECHLLIKYKKIYVLMRSFSDSPKQGDIKRFLFGKIWIDQILDEKSALVSYKYDIDKENKKQLFLHDFSTYGLVDESVYDTTSYFIIDGTYTYTTVNNAKRTIFSIRKVSNAEFEPHHKYFDELQRIIDERDLKIAEISSNIVIKANSIGVKADLKLED